jgi:hypothetical protein
LDSRKFSKSNTQGFLPSGPSHSDPVVGPVVRYLNHLFCQNLDLKLFCERVIRPFEIKRNDSDIISASIRSSQRPCDSLKWLALGYDAEPGGNKSCRDH